jgi:hypothetical protein
VGMFKDMFSLTRLAQGGLGIELPIKSDREIRSA